MQTRSVTVLCDVHCEWDGDNPKYRVFVNEELFAERTWRWTDVYLEESLPIEAVPGRYKIAFEFLPGETGSSTFKVKDIRVKSDNVRARIIKNDVLEILSEDQ